VCGSPTAPLQQDEVLMTALAETLISQFERMVRRDGGTLTLLGEEGGVIRVGYRMGADPTCTDGVCVMPHVELQTLMNETAERRAPGTKVLVELVS
jgi:hypothetical protein